MHVAPSYAARSAACLVSPVPHWCALAPYGDTTLTPAPASLIAVDGVLFLRLGLPAGRIGRVRRRYG